MKNFKYHLLFILLINSYFAHSENLGTTGQTYSLDRDAREQLKDAVRKKQANGELDAYWKNYRDKVASSIKNPAPLGISSNYGVHSELHDLKFILSQDYKNEKGQIVAKRGTVIEPLRIQPLQSGLIFIDGRDQKQIDYAIQRGLKQPLKIVLTAGSPLELRFKYQNAKWVNVIGIPFYFDQKKMIIKNLQKLYGIQINSVPVALYQRNDKLAIDFGMQPL